MMRIGDAFDGGDFPWRILPASVLRDLYDHIWYSLVGPIAVQLPRGPSFNLRADFLACASDRFFTI